MPAFYAAKICDFLSMSKSEIVGALTIQTGKAGFQDQKRQLIDSWTIEVEILWEAFAQLDKKLQESWGILLEYPIPRREKRIDAVLLASGIIFVIEFKTHAIKINKQDIEQVEDYCLDLRDFHNESINRNIVPVLLVEHLRNEVDSTIEFSNQISQVAILGRQNLGGFIMGVCLQYHDFISIDFTKWNDGIYSPTPTIIEAAQLLYARGNVLEISRSHAGIENLTATTDTVKKAIQYASQNSKKAICFITGVPGSGKTLAGLNIVHNMALHSGGDIGAFLSGNGPLIHVLREALARDQNKRERIKLQESRRQVKTFIQNVHEFLDAYFNNKTRVPPDHIIVFDEAQRAWNKEQAKRKFDRDFSEPEMILEIMDRHLDWAVVVALVGGGQEINSGEAGLTEWGRNLKEKFSHWEVFISHELLEGTHATGGMTLFDKKPKNLNIKEEDNLHLKVSLRSYKAEKLSEWVAEVINHNPNPAKEIFGRFLQEYPIFLTRDLDRAREWLQGECRGTRRAGLVCSSGALRQRRYGIDPKAEIEVEKWFLEPKEDVRSSSFLELALTEFGIQGLELDYACLCWDADLRSVKDHWDFYKFIGTKWQKVRSETNQQYLKNKYRVLLTRAREGLIIFVPRGDEADITRQPPWYNDIVEYLENCGVALIE